MISGIFFLETILVFIQQFVFLQEIKTGWNYNNRLQHAQQSLNI